MIRNTVFVEPSPGSAWGSKSIKCAIILSLKLSRLPATMLLKQEAGNGLISQEQRRFCGLDFCHWELQPCEAVLSPCFGNLGYTKAMPNIDLTFDYGMNSDASAHSTSEDEQINLRSSAERHSPYHRLRQPGRSELQLRGHRRPTSPHLLTKQVNKRTSTTRKQPNGPRGIDDR